MMGRERAIIRWEVHHQMLIEEAQRLERSLASAAEPEPAAETSEQPARLAELQSKRQALGPSPRAKMG